MITKSEDSDYRNSLIRWDGKGQASEDIMKLFRLSLFNIKKNKREAIAIAFLTLASVLMLGLFFANYFKISNAFYKSFEESGSTNTMIEFSEEEYRNVYKDVLTENYKIEKLEESKILYGWPLTVIKDDERIGYGIYFITEENDKKFEDFKSIESLSEVEIKNLDHPVWMPSYCKYNLGYRIGDSLTIESVGREYPFIIAGFYNSGHMNNSESKWVVTKEDYKRLAEIAETRIILTFDSEEAFDCYEYIDKCQDESGESIDAAYNTIKLDKANETQFLNMFLYVGVLVSLITVIASIFMIRNKISNDIEDQMQQIGVLEALGYTGKEISLSYVCEYIISAGIGTVIGGIIAAIITPLANGAICTMLGRKVASDNGVLLIIPVALLVMLVIIMFALLKAGKVKKYPPVIAFRKGIKTHSFKRNIFPMDKLKGNVNVRIALKESFRNIKTGIGVGICIVFSAVALLFGVLNADFFKVGPAAFISIVGLEVPDKILILNAGVDAYQLRDELSAIPEVRKVLVSYGYTYYKVKNSDQEASAVVHDDFSKTENIFVVEGRYPIHDNEVMITIQRSKLENYSIDDSIVVEHNGIEESYIITGIVGSMGNGANSIYLTTDGYKKINGGALPDSIYLYFEDGADKEACFKIIESQYGQSADNLSNESGETLEDKLSNEAKEKIATLISRYGVTDLDWAVQIGDKVYTGNSRQFVIKQTQDLLETLESQMGMIARISRVFSIAIVLVVALIVGVILGIIASSNVKRRSRELGIMKGLGYSSKDLMTQVAIGIIPVTTISVVTGTLLGVYLNKTFWLLGFGANFIASPVLLIVTDILMVVFCYLVTYIGAGRVRKISVNELITE